MQVPSAWPNEIKEKYDPIRVLGKGGFASVILARRRHPEATKSSDDNENDEKAPNHHTDLVAIKVAGDAALGVSKKERAYGHREIDILRALDHKNIMKCLDYAEPTAHTAMILVLTYCKGPTVEALLRQGGALSTCFGRVVIAQLVDALTYLHSHAVVHRDIKPDNVIVTGAAFSQDELWDNPEDYDSDDENAPRQLPDWDALRKKWHVTLVDFGFARALTKDDVHQPSPELHRENVDASYHHTKYDLGTVDNADAKAAVGDSTGRSSRSRRGSLGRSSLSRSLSLSSSLHGSRHGNLSSTRFLQRRMSALGSPQFAAPEIRKVQEEKNKNSLGTGEFDITNTISSFVADYGLLVDSYSLGCTIRYMMTGCPPHQSVTDAIASQSNVVDILCGMCSGGGKAKAGAKETRKPRYRFKTNLPGEVQRLIEKLTERDAEKRTSIRAARRYNWINDVLPADENNYKTITYLDFSNTEEDHAKHTPAAQ